MTTDQELIELYKAQRDSAEARYQAALADCREMSIRLDHAEHRASKDIGVVADLQSRIKELESALAALDADPKLDAYRRGVEDGIERVAWEGRNISVGSIDVDDACNRARDSFRAELKEQTDAK